MKLQGRIDGYYVTKAAYKVIVCCVKGNLQIDEKLVRLAERLSEYYEERMEELEYIDEYNEITCGRPVSYPGL